MTKTLTQWTKWAKSLCYSKRSLETSVKVPSLLTLIPLSVCELFLQCSQEHTFPFKETVGQE